MSRRTERKAALPKRVRKGLRNVGRGARNALDWIRDGRLGAPYQAPYRVVLEAGILKLRHYERPEGVAAVAGAPLLLVPPLMVTADVYDISPELSAVAWLGRQGIDVYVADFGVPEAEEGGLERTIDDHVLAIDQAITSVRERTGEDVHVAGYSQGGMFAYLVAAFRKCAGVASLIAFGAPVDMRKNLPLKLEDDLASRLLGAASGALHGTIEKIEGLPAAVTAYGFKLLSPRQELKYMVQVLGLLHDREALERREPRRRFLGGEGFVAWPGPAFRTMVSEFVARNRMHRGGMVIAGRAVSLRDITCPILYFVGEKDEIARPASVIAIERAAGADEVHRVAVHAGHFGLVVGTRALTETWPTVAEWMAWRVGAGERPALLGRRRAGPGDGARGGAGGGTGGGAAGGAALQGRAARVGKGRRPGGTTDRTAPAVENAAGAAAAGAAALGLYDLATDVVDGLWQRLGGVSREAVSVVDAMRWQFPRLAKLANLKEDSPVSLSGALAEQAHAIPDAPFFLWEGRAFSYREADARVNRIAHALVGVGVRAGQHVGVLMDNHPDYLTVVAALNRLRAVAVLLPAEARGLSLEQALDAARVELLLVDAAHSVRGLAAFSRRGRTLLLGADRTPADPANQRNERSFRAMSAENLPPDSNVTPKPPQRNERSFRREKALEVLDAAMEAAPTTPPPPAQLEPARARDLAMLMFTSGTTGLPKAARITNRRTILAGLGAAAACALTPADTVYCCLPLHHATGMLVACGGALMGGARLALAPRFSADSFWPDVHRAGATVVFYVGELCRYLVSAPARPNERHHPVRLFAGNGMRPQVWQQLLERFGRVQVIEFYGSTEGNLLLVNLTGEKVGSVGRDLAGERNTALVRCDLETGQPIRGPDGRLQRCQPEEPGLLIARIHDAHPLGHFDGYTDAASTSAKILRDVFEPDDAWFSTGDLARRDADGDFWFVDRLGETFRWQGENVSTEQVAAVLARAPFVALAAVYGVEVPGREGRAGMAALQLKSAAQFDGAALGALVEEHLTPAARPRYLRLCERLPTTDSLKLVKRTLQEQGTRTSDPLYQYDRSAHAYLPLAVSPP